MKTILLSAVFTAALMAYPGAQTHAQTQAQTPAAAVTATCMDGTSYTGPTQRGACARNGGVRTFLTTPATPAMVPPATAPASATPTAPTNSGRAASQPTATTAPGGGPGQVWVNTSSKVYHCQGDRYYGKTRRGSFMTEAAAKAAGAHAEAGKACS